MTEILETYPLNPTTVYMKFSAPLIAAKAKPGQFLILRPTEHGERIPLTIAEYDQSEGTVAVIFQTVGKTTSELARFQSGESICDLVGPLGKPSELDGYKNVAVIGGGLGCAIAYPQAKYLSEHGTHVDIIAGFRSKDIIILEDEMRKVSDTMILMTDDGSAGEKGLVTAGLERRILEGAGYDLVIAIGPPIMMKFVCKLTKQYGIKTIVSMNPIMVDGTGMCGGCRVTVGGQIKFACIDGPDFDGHEVDFDEMIRRNRMYTDAERAAMTRDRDCNLMKGGNQ